MGCTQSKIENEETVTRCKERRQFMKDAVSARNAFAAAHSAYAVFLKNTGAALSDYSHGEVEFPHSAPDPSSVILPPIPQPSYESFPPPPPLPNFASSPLQRASTMPEFAIPKSNLNHSHTILEEEQNEDSQIQNENHTSHTHTHTHSLDLPPPPPRAPPQKNRTTATPPPPPPPPPESKGMASWEFYFPSMENVPGPSLAEVDESSIAGKVFDETPHGDNQGTPVDDDGDRNAEVEMEETVAEPQPEPPAVELVTPLKKAVDGKRAPGRVVNLLQIFSELDDCFLKASESAHEVSKMLEATRINYHSNFADNRGHIDHSARLMRVITWNRSFKGLINTDDGMDDFDSEEHETHATILDKMLAWEKKLYDEVKAGEQMKLDYQRKVASLTKLKKRRSNTDALEKAKATVSQLHTRYIVDMQSMDSTVSEINRLRDEQLYPKLVALIDGMSTMWEAMRTHHESQSKNVQLLRFVVLSQSTETSEHHHKRTLQLYEVVREWQSQFEKLMSNQKSYIKSLNSWLKLNLIPIDNNLKEKVSSPQRSQNPPIQSLIHKWQDELEKIPEELARTAIHNFTAVVDSIVQFQVEEIKLLHKCKGTQSELDRKRKQFDDWNKKYEHRREPRDEMDESREGEDGHDENVAERMVVVESLKKKLEDEEEEYHHQRIQVREKSLTTLRTRLPELFRALSEFSSASSDMYRNLRSVAGPSRV